MARTRTRSVRTLFRMPSDSRLDVRRQMRGFDNPEKMKHHQRELAKTLVKGSKRERRLGKLLQSCEKANRCGSLACQSCMRRMRIGFVAATLQLIESLTGEDVQ